MNATTAALHAQISERKCRRTVEALARHGFAARYCATAAEAADALVELGAGAKSVGFGGSLSVAELGVRERFAAALASEPRRVFTKDELLRDVWGFRSQGRTRTLDSHASRLRRKLDPDATRFVVNCWGVGYRLIDG